LLVSNPGSDRALAGGALPGWVPVETVDKAFNDASNDVRTPQLFSLQDCSNFGPQFICSYASSTGTGILAFAPREQGLIEQLNLAIPSCSTIPQLADISAMLIHIFHPRRPVSTFSRAIVAMARMATVNGKAEYLLDGVSYQLIDRSPQGFGLVVRRGPPLPLWQHPQAPARYRAADKSQIPFFLPAAPCPQASRLREAPWLVRAASTVTVGVAMVFGGHALPRIRSGFS
jgi:hypothetical protein